jgi:sulfatase modifying factor 1
MVKGYISGDQAQKACRGSNKRLCSMDEWMSGCRGRHNNIYPYGNIYISGRCNEGRPINPVIEVFGKDANFNWTQMNDPRLDQLSHTVANSSEFHDCVSDFGLFHMHGNVVCSCSCYCDISPTSICLAIPVVDMFG